MISFPTEHRFQFLYRAMHLTRAFLAVAIVDKSRFTDVNAAAAQRESSAVSITLPQSPHQRRSKLHSTCQK